MNPLTKDIIPVSKWDQAMEDAFRPASGSTLYSNAAGIRRTCGSKPTRIRFPKKSNFKTAMDSYLRCNDEVRKMNLAAGLPPDTGISDSYSPSETQKTTFTPDRSSINIPDMSARDIGEPEAMSTGTKVLIAGASVLTLVALYFGIQHYRKMNIPVTGMSALTK